MSVFAAPGPRDQGPRAQGGKGPRAQGEGAPGPREGGKGVFIESRFLRDLETYRDVPLFMEVGPQPSAHFLNFFSQNVTFSDKVKPPYMNLRLSPTL